MCPDISHICVIILAGAEQPSLTWNSNQSDASIQCNTYNEIRQSPNTWSCPSHQASHAEPRSEPLSEPRRVPTTSTTSRAAPPSSDHVDHVPSFTAELRPPDHQTTSRAAPPSSDHQTTRPCPERLRRAPTTRPRRNDDRHEERRYDNRNHRHNRPKSSRTGQLHHRRPDFYPKISTLLIFIFNIIFITAFLHNILVMIIL